MPIYEDVSLGIVEPHSAAQYTNAFLGSIFHDPATMRVGKDSSSNQLGWAALYDVSSVPAGAIASDAKLTVKAQGQQSGTFNSLIEGIEVTEQVVSEDDVQQGFSPQAARLSITHPLFVNTSDTGNTGTGLTGLRISPFTRYTEVTQLLTITGATGALDFLSVYLTRTSTASSGQIFCELWSTTGPSGANLTGVSLSTPTSIGFTFPTNPTVVNGTVYGFRFRVSPEFTVDTQSLYVRTGLTQPDANEHVLVEGTPRGYQPAVIFSGLEGYAVAPRPVTADVPSTLPTFVNNVVYTLGTSGFSPDISVPQLTSVVQDLLDSRLGSRIGLRWHPDLGVSATERAIHGTGSATPTLDTRFGPILTFEYTVPGYASGRLAIGPLAAARGKVRPAVSGRGEAEPSVTGRVRLGED